MTRFHQLVVWSTSTSLNDVCLRLSILFPCSEVICSFCTHLHLDYLIFVFLILSWCFYLLPCPLVMDSFRMSSRCSVWYVYWWITFSYVLCGLLYLCQCYGRLEPPSIPSKTKLLFLQRVLHPSQCCSLSSLPTCVCQTPQCRTRLLRATCSVPQPGISNDPAPSPLVDLCCWLLLSAWV